jgi:hypothetical protein
MNLMSYLPKAKPFLISAVAVFILVVSYVACQRTNLSSGNFPGIDPVSTTFSLSGRITDFGHLPVSGATVKVGAVTTSTDINGYFRLNGVTVANPGNAFVRVEKDGFFSGSRTFATTAGSITYVAVQLIKKTIAGNFPGASGGTVQIPDNGGSIQIPANAVSTAGNTPYTGNVSVSAFFINPASGDFQEQMPGTLRGIDNSNQETGLQSFSMVAVELSGAGNEKLQMASGKTATITFPIPAGLQGQAPANIPLWSFNDSTALWKQEGFATRQGSNYLGVVSHFSFWNCDYPVPLVSFKGTVLNQDGNPLSFVKVLLKTVGDAVSTSGYGYTDSLGVITGTLPTNRNLQIVFYNNCGVTLETRNIGPFTSTANLGNLKVNGVVKNEVVFSGSVINCAGTAVKTGFVDISVDNNHYYGNVVNGSFRLAVSRCSSSTTTAIITALDTENSTSGAPSSITVSNAAVSTGELNACGNSASQYLNYTLDGSSHAFNDILDSFNVNKASDTTYLVWLSRKIRGSSPDDFTFSFTPTTTASTPLTNIRINNSNFTYVLNAYTIINITENGPPGGFIAGNFTTDMKRDATSSTYILAVKFRIKRPR